MTDHEVRENEWYLVDHDRDDKVVRGPYPDSSAAGAVRRELELMDNYYRRNGNLWIVSEHTLANMKEEK